MIVQRVLAAVSIGVLAVAAIPRTPEEVYPAPDDLQTPLWAPDVHIDEANPAVFEIPHPHPPHGPPHGPPPPDVSKKTIYQFLKEDEQCV